MLKNLKLKIKGCNDKKCKYLIEAEIEILAGITTINLDLKTGECAIDYDDSAISENEIIAAIIRLGYGIDKKNYADKPSIREFTYFVKGMRCASCEVLIERELLRQKNIKSVEASANIGRVVIEYENRKPTNEDLNKLFQSEDYTFFNEPIKLKTRQKLISFNNDGQFLVDRKKLKNALIISGVSLAFMVGFLVLHKSGVSALVSVNSKSALPMFIIFGILAGFSSCAALVGGIILSMSKQWSELYSNNASNFKKLEPHILFNSGRIISYGALGVILGAIGGFFQLSLAFTSALVIGVSVIMFFLALRMLGVKYFRKFQITMPKFVTRYVADESNFKGRYMPFLMGAATFFLPCGFTITAQGLALTSGNALQGGLIMLFFAIGTLPALFAIGLSSVTFTKNPHMAGRFSKIAGILVLFFALFNINAQLNVLGFVSLDDISLWTNKEAIASEDGLPEIVKGKQILKMDALAYGYEPKRLKVRSGIPVRWEITDKGTSGCTNAVMSKGLFDGQIDLTPGQTSIKEFTPKKPGRYKFSCWMGMVSGVIDVVDIAKDGSSLLLDDNVEIIDSGAKGCGCGGGGSRSRGGGGGCGG